MRLRLFPTPRSVGCARRAVKRAAAAAGMGAAQTEDVCLAVSEAVTNAMSAHQQIACDDPILVEAQANGFLEVAVTDAGGGFEPPSLAHGQAQAATQAGALEAGRGVSLMRALADEIRFERHAGTTVRMRFALPA